METRFPVAARIFLFEHFVVARRCRASLVSHILIEIDTPLRNQRDFHANFRNIGHLSLRLLNIGLCFQNGHWSACFTPERRVLDLFGGGHDLSLEIFGVEFWNIWPHLFVSGLL